MMRSIRGRYTKSNYGNDLRLMGICLWDVVARKQRFPHHMHLAKVFTFISIDLCHGSQTEWSLNIGIRVNVLLGINGAQLVCGQKRGMRNWIELPSTLSYKPASDHLWHSFQFNLVLCFWVSSVGSVNRRTARWIRNWLLAVGPEKLFWISGRINLSIQNSSPDFCWLEFRSLSSPPSECMRGMCT